MNIKYHPIEHPIIGEIYSLADKIQIELALYLNRYNYDFDFILQDHLFIEIFKALLNENFDNNAKLKIKLLTIIKNNAFVSHKYCLINGNNGLLTRIRKIIDEESDKTNEILRFNNNLTRKTKTSKEEKIFTYKNAEYYIPIFKKNGGYYMGYLSIKQILQSSDKSVKYSIKKYFTIHMIKSDKRIPSNGIAMEVKKIEWFVLFNKKDRIFTEEKIYYQKNFASTKLVELLSNKSIDSNLQIAIFNKKYAEIINFCNKYISYKDAINSEVFKNINVNNLFLLYLIGRLVMNLDLKQDHIGFNENYKITMFDMRIESYNLNPDGHPKDLNIDEKLHNLFTILKTGICIVNHDSQKIPYNNLEKFVNEYFIMFHIGVDLLESQIMKELDMVVNSLKKNFKKIKKYAQIVSEIMNGQNEDQFDFRGQKVTFEQRFFILCEDLKLSLQIYKNRQSKI